ncbi:MAG: RNA polymerase sigma factor RpoD, partial [Desulfomonile sp.]|nr:RNA polymerase sigma factor RpoD [Desulfomonile sp.]
MADGNAGPDLKDLIGRAKSKRYLTYDEVNEKLPPGVVEPEQIDEILARLMADYKVELVASEKKIPVTDKKLKKHDEEDKTEEEEDELPSDADSIVRGNDPVKMYLHEMGCVSLLTREGEVEIAKRIEQGEQQVFSVIIGCPVTIKEVLALGDKLRKGTIRLKEVIRGLEDEDMSDGDDTGQVE